jgi:hypothetical protein
MAYDDHVWNVDLEIEHSRTNEVVLEFSSNLGSAKPDESWGIAELEIGFAKTGTTCPTIPEVPDQCHIADIFAEPIKELDYEGWHFEQNYAPAARLLPFKECDTTQYVGQFANNGKAIGVYDNLHPHTSLNIKFDWVAWHSWSKEYFYVHVDGD